MRGRGGRGAHSLVRAEADPAATYDAWVPTPEKAPLHLRGLIVDWGGVLTAPIDEAMTTWARHEGIDLELYRTVMRTWIEDAASPVHALERGEVSPGEFERVLSQRFRE